MESQTLPSIYIEGFHIKRKVLEMKYKRLGNTDIYVSQLSFGGGAFSNFYSEFDEEEAIETIQEALRCGVNYIDTAPWYGQGRSEALLGKALKGVPRDAYYIGTKVGRYEVNYEDMFNFSAEKTIESFNKSLSLLGLDYVDIIQVHDVEFAPNINVVLKETLPSLQKIQESGKARYIGVTGYPLSVLAEIVKTSDVKIDTILTYCRNTLIDSSLDEYAHIFKEHNVGVICAAAHGMGLFTNAGPQQWHPASDSVKEICKEAANECKSKKVELGQLAMMYSMKNTNADTHLVGMNNRGLLYNNLAVMTYGLSESESKLLEELIERFYSKIKNTNWEGVEIKRYWEYMNNKK